MDLTPFLGTKILLKIPNIIKKIQKGKLSKNYIYYPYFEKDIENLNFKNYLL